MLRRPLDIAFVARALQGQARRHAPGLASADPDRVALIGYSMGGYGVLTVAGGALDPSGALVQAVPGGALAPYAAGGAQRSTLEVPGLKAVVAIAPAGVRFGAWGAEGLSGITTPLLVIGGDHDATVGFADGIAPVFAQARRAERWMLVFQNAGHGIGMSSAPAQMRERLYDFHWFEDPVWRKDRVMGIDQHFITAFLDLQVKGQADRAAYLSSDVEIGAEGRWPAEAKAYDARSPGGPGLTWKGFFRNTAVGLELRRATPGA
jgi:predicted dienelactone hydrolase